jgi:hypothetical protein
MELNTWGELDTDGGYHEVNLKRTYILCVGQVWLMTESVEKQSWRSHSFIVRQTQMPGHCGHYLNE